MNPFRRSVRPMFLFPNGNQLLEPIDGMAAGVEGLMAMRATDGNGNADFADFQVAQAMFDDDLAHGPALSRIGLDLGHLFGRHFRIRLVVQRQRYAVAGQVADSAQKRHHRAAVAAADFFRKAALIDRLTSKANHSISSQPPLTGGIRATSALAGSVRASSPYAPLTAIAERAAMPAIRGHWSASLRRKSPTVAAIGTAISTASAPANSRARANNSTRIKAPANEAVFSVGRSIPASIHTRSPGIVPDATSACRRRPPFAYDNCCTRQRRW